MKKMLINKIKDMLETEKNELVSKRNELDVDFEGDDTDIIQAKIIALTNAQLVARDKAKIVKIDNALKKIEDGKFGNCEECGEEIAEKRLMFNPGFTTCIVCAEKLEILARRK